MNFIVSKRHPSIPKLAQYLGGVGAGAWFYISKQDDLYRIQRFTEKGELTCNRFFCTEQHFDITKEFKFTYPSHCAKCTIIQDNSSIILKCIEEL